MRQSMEKKPHPQSYEALGLPRPEKTPRVEPTHDTTAHHHASGHTRIVDGCLFLRADTPYAHTIRVHELGHGHTEAIVMPCYGWEELGSLTPQAHADYLDTLRNPPAPTPLQKLDKAAKHKEKTTCRARTKVRRLIKAKNLDLMLTLTYRENVTDRETMLRDFDVFIKRVRRVVPGFEYLAVFERQKRGAWHAHIAVHRIAPFYVIKGQMIKSYDLLRRLWRASHTHGGNVDASTRVNRRRSIAYLASYLSKYIGKDLGDDVPKYGNTYSASGCALPKALSFVSMHPDLIYAVGDLHDLLGETNQSRLYGQFLPGSAYYLCLSPP